ncbi:hypothetical protein Tco_0619399 [Tanacetum coccineum]
MVMGWVVKQEVSRPSSLGGSDMDGSSRIDILAVIYGGTGGQRLSRSWVPLLLLISSSSLQQRVVSCIHPQDPPLDQTRECILVTQQLVRVASMQCCSRLEDIILGVYIRPGITPALVHKGQVCSQATVGNLRARYVVLAMVEPHNSHFGKNMVPLAIIGGPSTPGEPSV